MKMKQPHRVYLARQAVELLTLLKAMGVGAAGLRLCVDPEGISATG